MGYFKNVAAQLSLHARLQPQSCTKFRVYIPAVQPELVSPDMFESVLEYWVQEVDAVPVGNTGDRQLSESTHTTDRKVHFTAIFSLVLIPSLLRRLLYFTTHY